VAAAIVSIRGDGHLLTPLGLLGHRHPVSDISIIIAVNSPDHAARSVRHQRLKRTLMDSIVTKHIDPTIRHTLSNRNPARRTQIPTRQSSRIVKTRSASTRTTHRIAGRNQRTTTATLIAYDPIRASRLAKVLNRQTNAAAERTRL